MNVAYLMATAEEAGYPVELIAMSQIGWDVAGDRVLFVPEPGQEHKAEPIDVIFMLYPWEWFWNEEGGKAFFRNMADPTKRGTVWIEPPYKAALLGNKALLPVLWKLFGDDPERGKYLLPAYFAESSKAAELTQLRQEADLGPRGRFGHAGPRRGHPGGQPVRVRRGRPLRRAGAVRAAVLRRAWRAPCTR